MAALNHEKHSIVVPRSTNGFRLRVDDNDKDTTAATVEEGISYSKDESAQITRRSLSLLSRSSFRLLSQCSSLDSLTSLGLSFHKTSDALIEVEFQCAETLKKCGEQVLFSEDGQTVYTASSTGTGGPHSGVRIWSKLENHGSCVITREGSPVRAMALKGDLLFSSHKDLKIRVWKRAETNRMKDTLVQVAALPTLWDCMRRAVVPGAYVQVRRNQRKTLWIQHVDAISALVISHSHGLLYSASWDRSVKVWRLLDFKCVDSFRAHDDAVNTLAVSPDGHTLYTGSADSKVKVWARDGGAKKYMKHSLETTLTAHRSAVNALVVSDDGALLYSGACDKAIVVWERGPSMGVYLAGALRGHRHAVLCLAIMGSTLCSGSADRTIRIWHRVAGRLHTCLAVLEGHTAPIKSLSISSHLEEQLSRPAHSLLSSCQFSLYSASLDQDVKLWSVRLSTRACDVGLDLLEPALLQGGQTGTR